MSEYVGVYNNRQGSEYVSYNALCDVTLQVNEYLFRDGCIQNPVKDLKIIITFDYFRKTLHLKSSRGFWICVGF